MDRSKSCSGKRKNRKTKAVHSCKSFSGELVETEAEIARREGRDYETAEVCLRK
jgi:type I restriction enzyme S subunit